MKLFEQHPASAQAVASGDISFDRGRAIARLASSGVSEGVVDLSRRYDVNGVRRLSSRHRRMTRRSERSPSPTGISPRSPRSIGQSGGSRAIAWCRGRNSRDGADETSRQSSPCHFGIDAGSAECRRPRCSLSRLIGWWAVQRRGRYVDTARINFRGRRAGHDPG